MYVLLYNPFHDYTAPAVSAVITENDRRVNKKVTYNVLLICHYVIFLAMRDLATYSYSKRFPDFVIQNRHIVL